MSGTSIDCIFGRKSVYRLYSLSRFLPNLIAYMTTDIVYHHAPDVSETHPIRGKDTGRRVYHAVLEAYNSPAQSKKLPPIDVAVKWVRGKQAVDILSNEAAFYQNEMRELQGKVVPKCYGCFHTKIEGVDVGCLVLEWCTERLELSRDEKNRKRMIAVCELHAAGVEHGDLLDGHHFIDDTSNAARIIDFSRARVHRCPGAVPRLFEEQPGQVPRGCSELEDMEMRFGAGQDGYAAKYHY